MSQSLSTEKYNLEPSAYSAALQFNFKTKSFHLKPRNSIGPRTESFRSTITENNKYKISTWPLFIKSRSVYYYSNCIWWSAGVEAIFSLHIDGFKQQKTIP